MMKDIIKEEIEKIKQIKLNEMQKQTLKYQGENILIDAPTGSGKTIAILCNLKIGESYFYFLPTITSCHFMYETLKELKLYNLELNTSLREEKIIYNEIFPTIKICCPDMFFIKYLQGEYYNYNIILDELDNYPLYVQRAVIDYVKNPLNTYSHIIVASATLNKDLKNIFNNFIKIEYKKDLDITKHKIKIVNYKKDLIEIIKDGLSKNKKIGIICNSILDIENLEYYLKEFKEMLVLHSNISDKNRKQVEEKLYNNDFKLILSNDIISYSVDIDFDILITQPTDKLNLFIQRLGRNNRYNKDIKNTNLIILKDREDVPFIDYYKANELIEKYFNKDILTYQEIIKIKEQLHFENIPTLNDIFDFWEKLKQNNRKLALRDNPYQFKQQLYDFDEKQKRYVLIDDYITYKRNEIPYNRYKYDINGEKKFLYINGINFIIIKEDKETDTFFILPLQYIDKNDEEIEFELDNKYIYAYKYNNKMEENDYE